MRRSTWAPLACAILLACPAVAAADTKVSFNDGELSVVNEDAGIANKMSVEYSTHNGEPSIRLFDEADPAGMSTFPTPPCSPGQVNARGNPVELFCTRSAIRSVSIDIGPNEDGVTYKLDETPGVVTGGLGTDVLTTAGSNDLVGGDQGNDTLDSGAGDDDVRGGEGADTLSAGPGNDKILGGPDADTIDAGDGDDALNTADGVADKVACGPGNDSVTADTLDELADCENVQRDTVAAPAGGTTADDHTRPTLQAGGRSSQRIGGARRALHVQATSSEAGVVQITGYLVAGGINDRMKPFSAKVSVAGGGVSAAIKLTRTQLRRVRADLRKHQHPRARITISAVDAAGNTSRARHFWIAIRR